MRRAARERRPDVPGHPSPSTVPPTTSGGGHASPLGNRAVGRLLTGGGGTFAIQRQLVAGAGNRAMQRTPDEDETPPVTTTSPVQQQQQAHNETAAATTPLPESPYLTDNPFFHRGTQALDLVSGVGGARGGADFVGVSDAVAGTNMGEEAAREIFPEFLPGMGMLVNGIGTLESMVRADDAGDRSRTMTQAMPHAQGERAQQLLGLGAEEQDREQARHTARGWGGATQTLLMGAGITAGVSTGGTVPLAAATAIGGMKVAETVYNLARRYFGKEASQQHAQQLLFAAQAGDPAVILALQQMGIPAHNLEDEKVWDAATDRLGSLMPKESVEYRDGGAARSGPSVPIEQRRALQPRLPGDQPYGSVSSEDAGTPGNPLGGSGGALDQRPTPQQSIFSIDTSTATGRSGTSGHPLGGQPLGAFDMHDTDESGGYGDAFRSPFGQPPSAFGFTASAFDQDGIRDGRSTTLAGQASPPWLRPSARAVNDNDRDSDHDDEGLAQAVYMEDVESDTESEADVTAASGRRWKK